MGVNLKRKELEEINDEFSDIFLASPARKIRRLDAELPPIIEEEEAEIPLGLEQNAVPNRMSDQLKPLDIEELPLVPDNEDKAIVLFKPVYSQLVCSYSVDPNLISSFKNQVFLGSHLNASRPNEEDENRDNAEGNTCRAVIPWVPSHQLDQKPAVLVSQTEVSEAMDNTEEMEAATMDIDDADTDASNVGQQAAESNHSNINEGLQCQWQQQHCMISQPPQHTTNPIMWYR